MKVIEQEICKRVATAFKAVLPGFDVEGNFLPDETGTFKGMEVYSPGKLIVTVGARSYPAYTTLIATVRVELECEIPVEADASLERALAAFGAATALLEEWHGNLAAVKRDIGITPGGAGESGQVTPGGAGESGGFDPVGLRLSGGDFDLDRDDKTRRFSQSFEIKGRIM